MDGSTEIAVRPLAEPPGGDGAEEMMNIVDPVSGMPFTIARYAGYHKAMLEVSCLYGVKCWNPDFLLQHLG